MKLPPVGLTAPTLCPRCDTPTAGAGGDRAADQCSQCALQLRWCGNCRGVAGPFDRYCGFCGFELIRGHRRNPLWRLWVVAALVPLVAGLGYGIWVAHAPEPGGGFAGAVLRPSPNPTTGPVAIQHDASGLGLRYAAPRDWTVVDHVSAIVASRSQEDQSPAGDAGGDLTRVAGPQSVVVALSRPQAAESVLADTRDPVAALTSQVAPLVAAPPPGLTVEVSQPVRSVTLGGRPAAAVVLRLVRDGSVSYLRRDLVYAPRPKLPAMLRADALVPEAEWPAADTTSIATILRSLRFS